MTDKQKNLVIRSITGVFFVVCMVSCFLQSQSNGYPVRPDYRTEHLGVLRIS